MSIATVTTTTPTAQDLAGSWDVDAGHSRLGFTARHAMVAKVRGAFTDFTGSFVLDPADPAASSATATVQLTSVNTDNDQRDGHLRSPDFFDVENHPEMTFTSTGVSGTLEEFALAGDLTIRGVSRPVILKGGFLGVTTDPWGNTRAGFEATTTISRKDWDLTWNVALEAGGFLVSDKVEISLDISAVKRAG